mmetsp:Transcript_6859/g.22780  ORF Transcript_6859/g.22780 Transcript_6859/m.22780 type:complete len:280 (-) Transcript_6859:1636-2475(-)
MTPERAEAGMAPDPTSAGPIAFARTDRAAIAASVSPSTAGDASACAAHLSFCFCFCPFLSRSRAFARSECASDAATRAVRERWPRPPPPPPRRPDVSDPRLNSSAPVSTQLKKSKCPLLQGFRHCQQKFTWQREQIMWLPPPFFSMSNPHDGQRLTCATAALASSCDVSIGACSSEKTLRSAHVLGQCSSLPHSTHPTVLHSPHTAAVAQEETQREALQRGLTHAYTRGDGACSRRARACASEAPAPKSESTTSSESTRAQRGKMQRIVGRRSSISVSA